MHLPRSLEVTVLTETRDGLELDSQAVLFANAIAGFVTHPEYRDKGGLVLKSERPSTLTTLSWSFR